MMQTDQVPKSKNNKRKANPVDATVIEMQSLQPKKRTKKKGGNDSQPAVPSEEQPSHLSDMADLGEQDPDFTIQPGDEVVELVPDGTQDEGTRSHPLYSMFLDVVEELYDDDFPPYKVPVVAPFLPVEKVGMKSSF